MAAMDWEEGSLTTEGQSESIFRMRKLFCILAVVVEVIETHTLLRPIELHTKI